jgi:hypothetical protein
MTTTMTMMTMTPVAMVVLVSAGAMMTPDLSPMRAQWPMTLTWKW